MQTVAMLLTALLIPRLRIHGPLPALMTVICLAFFNAHFWDAALFLNIPNNLSQSTLLLFLLNGVFFWILIKLLPGIEVKGFLPALAAPVVFTLCSILISQYGSKVDWVAVYGKSTATIAALRDYVKSPNAVSEDDEREPQSMRAMPRAKASEDSHY
jgi:putative membrane protein